MNAKSLPLAQVIYKCGCTSVLPVITEGDIGQVGLSSSDGKQWSVTVRRVAVEPPTFLEVPDGREKPEWATHCHNLVALDFNRIPEVEPEIIRPLIEPFKTEFGVDMIPLCWLPELLGGRGRFYRMWRWSPPLKTKTTRGHLRVVEMHDEDEAQGAPEETI